MSTKQELVGSLTETIHELHTLSVIVEDFQPNSQAILYEKLNNYVKNLRKLNEISKVNSTRGPDPEVTVQVLDCLDDEKRNNPELYTKQTLQKCYEESQTIEERVYALKILREELGTGLEQLAKDL